MRIVAVLLCLSAWGQADFTGSYTLPIEDDSLGYNKPPDKDAVTRLQRRIDRGEVKLEWSEKNGWLGSVLNALKIPASSQGLVFSKTSFQLQRIGPATPRAIYFNDDAYVGWVPDGDVMEISTADPERGGMFYTLEQKQTGHPVFVRRDECLQCHASPKTTGVPGHLVRSVFTNADGFPQTNQPSYVTDHRSPWQERWGGWFVSGAPAGMEHMGVAELPETKLYLSQRSDIVALMVLEHQTKGHNLIARVGYEARMALATQAAMDKALGRAGEWSETTRGRINRAAEILVRYLTFVDEARLSDPVPPTPFAEEFAKVGPRDAKGRSLRDFDLATRMFRYPLSYLIYSEAFDALPAAAKDRVWQRLRETVSPEVREIVAATKPGLPDYWRK